jgi:arylsulfatase
VLQRPKIFPIKKSKSFTETAKIKRLKTYLLFICLTGIIPLHNSCAQNEKSVDSTQYSNKLPADDPEFQGKIGRTYKDSEMAWPELPSPPKGAPNVVVILLDDVGFGMTSTFGGSIPTPNLDSLANEGLRYNRFHTTAICGPSRAVLITGRNHHNSGSGFLAEWATGYPSYTLAPRAFLKSLQTKQKIIT